MDESNGYTRKKGGRNAEGMDAGRDGGCEAEERGAETRREGGLERFPKIYTAKDIAQIMRLDIGTVYRMHRTGKLPAPLPLSNSLRWNGVHFDRWIDEGCPPPKKTGSKAKTPGKSKRLGTSTK